MNPVACSGKMSTSACAVIMSGTRVLSVLDAPAGTSIREFAAAHSMLPEDYPLPVVAMLNAGEDNCVLHEDWSTTVLHAGDLLVLAELPMGGGGGGGSNPLQAIFAVAMIAAMVLVPQASIFAAGGVLAGWGGAAGAAIGLVGSLVSGLLFSSKPSGQKAASAAEQASPTYSINGTGNQARLEQPVPKGFGRMRIVPDIVASQWTQYIGNNMYWYGVFGCGRGTYQRHSMSFGDVKFWEDGQVIESALGTSITVQEVEPGGTVTLFPDNVETSPNVASQELLGTNEENYGWIGPFPINSPGTQITQAMYNFVFPGGLGQYDEKGRFKNRTVSIEIRQRAIDDYDNPLGEWKTVLARDYHNGTMTALRYTEEVQMPPGRYLAQARRTTPKDTDNNAVERIEWEALTGIIPGSLTYDQSVVAIKIKATNTLSQAAANTFSVIQTAKLPLYDREKRTWSEPVPTRSWAAAISDVCRDVHGGALSDKEIDLDTLWGIDEILQSNNWNFDAWIDGAYEMWPLLIEMCMGYRVLPRLAGSTLSFVYDQPSRPVRHTFTMHDIVRGSFALTPKTFNEDSPDHIVVEYLDGSVGYVPRDVSCKLPDGESEKAATINYMGIVNRDHAYATGNFYGACNRWRRLGCEFETEGVGRLLNIGDVISISHPRLRDTASGTVAGWDAKGLTLKLSEDITPVIPEGSDSIYLSLTLPDGSPWGPCKLLWWDCGLVRFDPGDFAVLMMKGMPSPFAAGMLSAGDDSNATTWTLQRGREFSRRYIITALSPVSTYHYRITCINDSDKINDYDDLKAPPHEHRFNLPDFSILPAPSNLRVTLSEGTAEKGLLTATWEEVPSATAYEVEIGADGINWTRFGHVNANTVQIQVAYDDVWFRVSTVRVNLQSTWSMWQGTFDLSEEGEGEAA